MTPSKPSEAVEAKEMTTPITPPSQLVIDGKAMFAAHRELINGMTHAEYVAFKARRAERLAKENPHDR